MQPTEICYALLLLYITRFCGREADARISFFTFHNRSNFLATLRPRERKVPSMLAWPLSNCKRHWPQCLPYCPFMTINFLFHQAVRNLTSYLTIKWKVLEIGCVFILTIPVFGRKTRKWKVLFDDSSIGIEWIQIKIYLRVWNSASNINLNLKKF